MAVSEREVKSAMRAARRLAGRYDSLLAQRERLFGERDRLKGDLPGHEFHGNQWGPGTGGMAADTGGGAGGRARPASGTWDTKHPAVKQAIKIVGSKVVKKLKELGINVSTSDRTDVAARGGAVFSKYTGGILIGKDARPMDVVHEIGHAVDSALTSGKHYADRSFDEKNKDWSDKGLKKAIAADEKLGKPNGWSSDDPVRSWEYAFSSTREAFAHAYAQYHGDDLTINGFTFQQALPNVWKASVAYIKKVEK